MSSRNKQIKQETRVDKIPSKDGVVRSQLNSLPVAGQSMSETLPKSPTTTRVSLEGAHTTRSAKTSLPRTWQLVPVIGMDRKPLMPTTPWRAERWIKSRKATPFFSMGVFCVRLNVPTKMNEIQEVAVGVDPGSKREAFTVMSANHTYLNILADAVTGISDDIKIRRTMRKSRRNRKTPCRKNRGNRAFGGMPPSIKARWLLKLRIIKRLSKIYPISYVVAEDVKAASKGDKRWDSSFSPVQMGKNWFYDEIKKKWELHTKAGYETKELRDNYGLLKTKSKMRESFSAHNVDSWVLAAWFVGGLVKPENTELLRIFTLRFHRRRLHAINFSRGATRRNYGGTRSIGFKRGSIIKHKRHGLCFIGGTSNGMVSLHNINTSKRISQSAHARDIKFLSYNSFGGQAFILRNTSLK